MKKHLKNIKKAEWHDLVNMLPYKEVLDILEVEYGKMEARHLHKFMAGQTMGVINEQPQIYVVDLMNFIKYRKQNLSGKNMPLDD